MHFNIVSTFYLTWT